jgi:hypothetical protein
MPRPASSIEPGGQLADRLRCQGVTLVVMKATSSCWKPPFYLLEAERFECWLLNARHVKNVPGRPKTDKLDSYRGRLTRYSAATPQAGATAAPRSRAGCTPPDRPSGPGCAARDEPAAQPWELLLKSGDGGGVEVVAG